MTAALAPFAPGFEEMEGVIIVDVCRRAGWQVETVGLAPGLVRASRGVQVQPDRVWADIDPLAYDILILPGGGPGTDALIRDPRVLETVRAYEKAGKWVAAICAAALVLQAAGILKPARKVTCHPAVSQKLTTVPRQSARTVVDGRLVTSQGPGTAFDFALTLIRLIDGPALAEKLSKDMVLT